MKNTMVYVETDNGVPVSVGLEALAFAKKIAKGDEILAVVIDKKDENGLKKIMSGGASKIILVEDEKYQSEKYKYILKELIKKYEPTVFIAGSSLVSKDFVGNLAKNCKTNALVDVVDVKEQDGKLVATCPTYGGTILNDIEVDTKPIIMLNRPGAFAKELGDSEDKEIIVENIDIPNDILLTEITDIIKEASEVINLEEAEVIVSVGRGMGSKENCKLAEELAEVCGGVLGGTRPAIEDEWIARCYQVGQSGKIVSPKLYIACGISGATQHLSGMVGSKYIIAINKDEDAPIFDVADVGIVGDVTKILPLLTQKFKEIKS